MRQYDSVIMCGNDCSGFWCHRNYAYVQIIQTAMSERDWFDKSLWMFIKIIMKIGCA